MQKYNNSVNSPFGATEIDRKRARKGMLGVVAVLIFGIGLSTTLAWAKYFLIALKPAYTVDELLENGAREGMHVKGQIPYIYDCFASMENFNNGRIEADYYALPAKQGFLIVKMPVESQPEMENLIEETVEFMGGGSWPASPVFIEGYVEKAQGRLPYLLGEYMAAMGYTQEQLDAIGEPFVVVEGSGALQKARISLPVGIILQSGVVLGVVFYAFYIRRRKA